MNETKRLLGALAMFGIMPVQKPIETGFETAIGCERCGCPRESSLQYSPNDNKELYLCKACFDKEFREAITVVTKPQKEEE